MSHKKHAHPDCSYYFITCRTKDGTKYFGSARAKKKLLSIFGNVRNVFMLKTFIYAILDNRYYLYTHIKKGEDIKKIMRTINRDISKQLCPDMTRRTFVTECRSISTSKTTERKILGYILGSPLKHRAVGSFDELYMYQYCSYGYLVDRYGEEFVIDTITAAP